ncbi:NO-inducible flavohemoprotein [Roseomonas sp. GC11]|uniref:NO-inducible flavohemoprotein n=1 Tax=Roseomonas sp. GC11 TaxID=2950546 RepID=UPI00210EC4ED|nr:NO-inducible flavohemoprotein [Roseomonas sp. GC11]MCQ4159463.1 NO-inducible flavohemoprotein [Roseomonas sp. GC11]
MPQPLSPATIALVKATIPALAEHGTAITAAMYRRLFADAGVRALFNHAHQGGEEGTQVRALAAAVLAYARHIENPAALAPAVERIAQKHVGHHILPEHYPIVAEALLGAISEVLGAAATPAILAAWGEAYWFLAEILTGREGEIRRGLAARPGGWEGWRAFRVAARRQESSVITSFVLEPADGGVVLPHRPGQYLTFRLELPGGGTLVRNYSISCAPNERHYRISVKREAAGQGGSRFLHDAALVGTLLHATPPAGDFVLPEAPPRPVVLLSGGVGLTPMVSMAETIAARHPGLETHFIHAALNSGTHAMGEHLRGLAARHGRMRVTTFYSDPLPADRAGTTHDETGLISAAWLQAHAPLAAADVYLCGPKPFMAAMLGALRQAGLDPARLHFETFGPADAALAA